MKEYYLANLDRTANSDGYHFFVSSTENLLVIIVIDADDASFDSLSKKKYNASLRIYMYKIFFTVTNSENLTTLR